MNWSSEEEAQIWGQWMDGVDYSSARRVLGVADEVARILSARGGPMTPKQVAEALDDGTTPALRALRDHLAAQGARNADLATALERLKERLDDAGRTIAHLQKLHREAEQRALASAGRAAELEADVDRWLENVATVTTERDTERNLRHEVAARAEELEKALSAERDEVALKHAACEGAWATLADLREKLKATEAERDAGVPSHPGGPHSKAGCRIGDRLDITLAHLKPSGHVADTAETIRRALAGAPYSEDKDAALANVITLATLAQGHEAATKERDNTNLANSLIAHERDRLRDYAGLVENERDAAQQRAEAAEGLLEHAYATAATAQEREQAAVADNAALREAVEAYVEFHGGQHEEDDCPEDDACTCPHLVALNAALSQPHPGVELLKTHAEEVTALKADNAALLEIVSLWLKSKVEHEDGNAPGHAHGTPKHWDKDGTPCHWCITEWPRLKAMARAPHPGAALLERLKALESMATSVAPAVAVLARAAEVAPELQQALLAFEAAFLKLNHGEKT